MLSFRLPTQETLDRPFVSYGTMKAVLRKEQKGIYRYVGQTVPTTCPTGTNAPIESRTLAIRVCPRPGKAAARSVLCGSTALPGKAAQYSS
jgi:hypothetical protein